ncbi:MAG: MFS transporter [Chloroflexia bacterium]
MAATPAPRTLAEHLNASLISAIVVGFLLRAAGGATGILLGFYLNRVVSPPRIDPAIVAALTAAYYAAEVVLAPVFGSWSDRIGRKPFLLAGPIIAGVAVQLHPLTTILFVIFIGRILEGLATSVTTPGTLGFLSDVTGGHPALRGRVMGLYELGTVLGIVVGPALGGRLWDAFERNGLRFVSLLDLAAALLVMLYIRESRPVTQADATPAGRTLTWPERFGAYRGLFQIRRLWDFAPAWIAINGVVGLWFTHADKLLSRVGRDPVQLLQGGWTGTQVSNMFLGVGLAFLLGIAFWANLYARLRKTNIMLAAICGTFVVVLALFGINMQVLPGPLGQWPLVPIFLAALFFESGFTPVALAYLADITESRVKDRGTVMGLYSVFLALGNVIGAALGAPFISAFGFNGLLIATAILASVAAAAVLNLRRNTGD